VRADRLAAAAPQELQGQKVELMTKVGALKADLQDWKSRLDANVAGYKSEVRPAIKQARAGCCASLYICQGQQPARTRREGSWAKRGADLELAAPRAA
jgi:hypothetical protein